MSIRRGRICQSEPSNKGKQQRGSSEEGAAKDCRAKTPVAYLMLAGDWQIPRPLAGFGFVNPNRATKGSSKGLPGKNACRLSDARGD
ncbi:hypothetical protein QUF80_06560 [Desulfococcaceae bacterium HSG8]|nr:hypothetical protein [Desulfococcaceae bacterium HSG8]